MSEPHPLDKEEHGKDHKPVDATKAGAKKIPLYEQKRPHKLDGGIAMAVFLRRIYERTYLDDDLKGDARSAKVIFAADDASELVKEIGQLAALEKPNWSEVDDELAHALRGMSRVEKEAPPAEKLRIMKAREELKKIVDPKVFAAAEKALPKDDKLPAMSEQERLEMAAQAIIGACRQAAIFNKHTKTAVTMDTAREHFTHMRLHYVTAMDAISGITDKRMKQRLKSDIVLATEGMGGSEELLKSEPKLPWDRSFAQAFDAERHFLEAMGLDSLLTKPRLYSGNMNPNDAIKAIEDVAAGRSKGDWTEKPFDSPQQAVQGIGVVMDEIYARQGRAVKRAVDHIAEPRVPKEPGILETLLEILIKTALAGAAGAIGSKIAAFAKGKIESSLATGAAQTSLAAGNMFKEGGKGDFFEGKGNLAIASGAAATTMKSEAAKDAFKEFFKSAGYKAIMSVIASKGKPSSNSTNPLTIFREHSEDVLDDARLQGRLAFVHLAPALGQAEPAPLHELYKGLLAQLDDYHEIQYDFVMTEWQNFKARMHNGVADDHSAKDKHLYDEKDAVTEKERAAGKQPQNDKNTGSDAKVGRDGPDYDKSGEKGALLITARIVTDDFIGDPGAMTVEKVQLPDAEDATLKHLRSQDRKELKDVHMNKHYRLKFVMYMDEHILNVGVGADHGFQESTLNKKELAILRVAAAGDRVTNTEVIVAMDGTDPKYNRFTDKELHGYLKRYIKKIESYQLLRKLER